jgi:membrane dipeptidase
LKLIDGHCDVLWKMLHDEHLSFDDAEQLHVTETRLKATQHCIQNFAIFDMPPSSYRSVQRAIMRFREDVLTRPGFTHILSKRHLETVWNSGDVGALLSLESVDGLEGEPTRIDELFRLGVRIMSLTWNDANWAATGCLAATDEGIHAKGYVLLERCAELGMIIDVSHASDRTFWQLLETVEKPLIATHSNCRTILPHPRNLTDEQIKAIIARDGMIGLNFVPMFLAPNNANVSDFLRHLDHVLSLGGEHHIGFGSDFDGIDKPMHGMEHAGMYQDLYETLSKHYTYSFLERFFWQNWLHFLSQNLPSDSSNFDIDFI